MSATTSASFLDLAREVWAVNLPLLQEQLADRQAVVPIRARSAWDEAIAWLEAHQSAREEWPWPERQP